MRLGPRCGAPPPYRSECLSSKSWPRGLYMPVYREWVSFRFPDKPSTNRSVAPGDYPDQVQHDHRSN